MNNFPNIVFSIHKNQPKICFLFSCLLSYSIGMNGLDVEQCFPMQKNISLKLTNEQVLLELRGPFAYSNIIFLSLVCLLLMELFNMLSSQKYSFCCNIIFLGVGVGISGIFNWCFVCCSF